MAFDRAIAEKYDPLRDRPVLRLYSFSSPAISLGRFQKADEVVNLNAASKDGIEVARRVTGGGAIFHCDELTYSMVFPRDLLTGHTTQESYRFICSFLIETYRKLGFNASYAGEKSSGQSEICFAGREKYDIIIEEKKAGGNAQKRFRNKIFQHGSIPFKGCGYEIDVGNYFKKSHPSGDSVFRFKRSCKKELIKHLIFYFQKNFNCILEKSDPSDEELKRTESLIEETMAA